MKTPFDVIMKIYSYKDAIEQLEKRASLEYGRGNMADYWHIKGTISAYKKVTEDFEPFKKEMLKS